MVSRSHITGKRIIAFLIDFFLSLTPTLFFRSFTDIDPDSRQFSEFSFFVTEMLMLFRDPLYGGRSIGKRLTGLVNVDINTYCPCTSVKLILKTLMFCLGPIEAMVLLFSHKSVGERITNIRVLHITNPHIIFPVAGTHKLGEHSDRFKVILTFAATCIASALILAVAAPFFV